MHLLLDLFGREKQKRGGGGAVRQLAFTQSWISWFHREIPNLLLFLGSPSKLDPALNCVTDDIMVRLRAQGPDQVS